MEMAHVENAVDFTANLPDELLWKVFSYLPLRGKLRLESVSHRFQRIILDLLKQPQPLELSTYPRSELNGYRIRLEQLSEALWALASKSKFSRIKIWFRGDKRNVKRTEQMDSLLSILLVTNCLDKVVSFTCNYSPSQDILEKVFTQCIKLSSLSLLYCAVRPPNIQMGKSLESKTFALDLNTLLSMKALTRLDLRLTGYSQDRLVELFRSLKSHTLLNLDMIFYEEVPPLDLAEMVKQLSTNGWAALQELNIDWEQTFETAHIGLAKFFESLALIPSLNKCDIFFDLVDDIEPENEFVAAMTSLFKSDIKITVTSPWSSCILRPEFSNIPDCQAVANIRELQKVFPSMVVDFSINASATRLTLSMGNGLFEELVNSQSCGVADCFECHRFYPAVLVAFMRSADEYMDTHLEGYQLDRCRIDKVVEDLEEKNDSRRPWRAISSALNDAGDLVTIGFEVSNEDGADGTEIHQYNVTVHYGPCFSNSCIRCDD